MDLKVCRKDIALFWFLKLRNLLLKQTSFCSPEDQVQDERKEQWGRSWKAPGEDTGLATELRTLSAGHRGGLFLLGRPCGVWSSEQQFPALCGWAPGSFPACQTLPSLLFPSPFSLSSWGVSPLSSRLSQESPDSPLCLLSPTLWSGNLYQIECLKTLLFCHSPYSEPFGNVPLTIEPSPDQLLRL